MLTSLSIVGPIFAVIAIGFICGRLQLFGPTASSELNRFVVYLGLPALLFEVMAGAKWPTLWQPQFIAAFAIGAFAVSGAALAYRLWHGHHLTDASIDGLNAGYANVGYIGFPLCEAVFGRQSLTLVTIAAIITVSFLFAIAIVFVEIGLQVERRPHHLAIKVAKALIRNPLLISPILGALWSTLGTPIPQTANVFLHLMGNAATPCALVALGLTLAVKRDGARSSRPIVLALASLKLIVQPAITAVFAYGIFRLPATPAAIAVLLSALPTGTGAFMVAEYYNREATVTSASILLSTVVSVLTVTGCLVLIGPVRN